MARKTKQIPIEVIVGEDVIANALCSGVSGGISYWCDAIETKGKLKERDEMLREDYGTFAAFALVGSQCSARVHARDGKWYPVTRTRVLMALDLMHDVCPTQFQALIDDNVDATTGDVLIQLAAFGELIYG